MKITVCDLCLATLQETTAPGALDFQSLGQRRYRYGELCRLCTQSFDTAIAAVANALGNKPAPNGLLTVQAEQGNKP